MAGLLPHLGRACRDARKTARIPQITIATRVEVSVASVSRFERGVFWPHYTDEIVSAYAEIAEVAAIELWIHALAAWASTAGPRA